MLRGRVHEARLYDVALTEEEIEASSRRGAMISRAEVRAKLGERARDRIDDLEAEILARREELRGLGEARDPDEVWPLLAHAIFNLKEFLYVR